MLNAILKPDFGSKQNEALFKFYCFLEKLRRNSFTCQNRQQEQIFRVRNNALVPKVPKHFG